MNMHVCLCVYVFYTALLKNQIKAEKQLLNNQKQIRHLEKVEQQRIINEERLKLCQKSPRVAKE